jgi:hypothetical protein
VNIGRLARTVTRLHPLQLATRAPHAVVARAIHDIPGALPPRAFGAWPEPHRALRHLANAERARGAGRLARLASGSRLRAYESCYGLELGANDDAPAGDWTSRTAVEPYPASIRARRMAVAMRCGRGGLESELARAARAVLLQPEVHLLGNHLLENGFALACAASAMRGVEPELWWNASNRLLSWQLPQQFMADGGHSERSASYHVALTAALLETIELTDASGRRAPRLWRDVATTALGWIAAVRAPDGTYPLFNDAALDAAPTIDDVLALGAALDLVSGRPSEPRGWVRLANERAWVIVDAGSDAEGWQTGHVHADGLTFELWVDGERSVVDFGVSSYEPGPQRDDTRATRSHNTVEIGGVDSCEVWAAFRLGRRGRGRVLAKETRHGVERLELEHDGYSWMPGEPRHCRSFALSARGLEVQDWVTGGAAEWRSHLRLASPGRVRVSSEGELQRHEDPWHPRHGDPRGATVMDQRSRGGDARRVVWRLEW